MFAGVNFGWATLAAMAIKDLLALSIPIISYYFGPCS